MKRHLGRELHTPAGAAHLVTFEDCRLDQMREELMVTCSKEIPRIPFGGDWLAASGLPLRQMAGEAVAIFHLGTES